MALFLSQFGLLLKKYSPKSICSIFEGQKYVEFANEQAANSHFHTCCQKLALFYNINISYTL